MLAAGTTLGPYKILALLGSGGMGEVYRARDTRLGRDVAIKVISAERARDPERIKRFGQEARAAGALNHPNVCTILDLGAYEGSPFVVMELLEGGSLREKLNAGPIPVRKAIDYVAQAARGLAAAHEKGIVHRDLKPENLFVTKDARVKVLDFGLAKLTRPEVLAPEGEQPISIAATETGAILGTAGYMAPEQVRGQAADARSDLFALGAILYELVTGKRAFHGASYVETLHAILNEEPAPLSAGGRDMPPALEHVVSHCLEKNAEERFQTARDLAFDLQSLVQGAVGTVPVTGTKPVRGGARFGFGVVAACSLASALLVATIAVLLGLHARPTTAPSRVTYRKLTAQRGGIWNARFSPDGKTVLYAASWDGRSPEIFETRPGIPTSRSVGVPQSNLLSISRSGTMAVTLEQRSFRVRPLPGTLAEVPISGGMPRRILDDVLAADWTPDGRTLAVTHRVGSKLRLEKPPGHVLYETSGNLRFVRVSPNGRWLAFVESPVELAFWGCIVIMDSSGRVITRTREWKSMFGLAWSADGREVWFSSSEDVVSSDLRAVTPEGKVRVVARFPGWVALHDIGPDGRMLLARTQFQVGIRGRSFASDEERELGWMDWPIAADISSDGRTLLFDEQGMGGGPNYSVCVRGMDGSPPVRLGEGSARSLSPDGQWALAVQQGPPFQLNLLPTGVGDTTSLPRGRIEKYDRAGWLPDGKSVVFEGAEAGRAWRTYVQEVNGRGLPRPITPEGMAGARVSPDGYLVAAVSSDRKLFVCPVAGGEPTLVADLQPDESVAQWTADGRSLYLVHSDGASMSVTRIDRNTGKREPWRSFSMPDPAGVGRMSLVLTPDGRAYACGYARLLDELYLVEGLK